MIATSTIKTSSTLATLALLCGMVVAEAAAADLDQLVEGCANCHGEDGASTEPTVATIGGLSEQYIIDSMASYRDRDRACIESEYIAGPDKGKKSDMCKIADALGEGDIESLAKFYAGKQFVRAKQAFDATKAAAGQKIHEASCEKCHEDGGTVAEDDAGILGGQWMPYLEHTFKSYMSGERLMPKKMQPKMEKLTDQDIDNLVHYYGSLQ